MDTWKAQARFGTDDDSLNVDIFSVSSQLLLMYSQL
jgi:hypothetical protein